jgi:hypothetical protein
MTKNDGSEERELHDLAMMRNARLRKEVGLMSAQATDLGRQLQDAISVVDRMAGTLDRVLIDGTFSDGMVRVDAQDALLEARFYLKTGHKAKGEADDDTSE